MMRVFERKVIRKNMVCRPVYTRIYHFFADLHLFSITKQIQYEGTLRIHQKHV